MVSFLTIVFAVCLINGNLIGFSEQVRGQPVDGSNLLYNDFLFPLVYIRFFSETDLYQHFVYDMSVTNSLVRLVIQSFFLQLYFFISDAQNVFNFC